MSSAVNTRTVKIGRKAYQVVIGAADGAIIRISYTNAVLGSRPLDLSGQVAKQVIAALVATK